MATKILLKQKHRLKHLNWTEEENNWTVAQWFNILFMIKVNVALYLEIRVPESGGSVERHRIQAA